MGTSSVLGGEKSGTVMDRVEVNRLEPGVEEVVLEVVLCIGLNSFFGDADDDFTVFKETSNSDSDTYSRIILAGDAGSVDGIPASPCNFSGGDVSRIYCASRLLAISANSAKGLLTGKTGADSGFIGVNLLSVSDLDAGCVGE